MRVLSVLGISNLFTDPAFIVGLVYFLVFLALAIVGAIFLVKAIQSQKYYNSTVLPSLEPEEDEQSDGSEESAFDMEALGDEYGESESETLLAELNRGQTWRSAATPQPENRTGDELDISDYLSDDDDGETQQQYKIEPTRFSAHRNKNRRSEVEEEGQDGRDDGDNPFVP